MAKIAVTLHFDEPGYIAHPMTEVRDTLINILKKSGYNRARGEAKRQQVLTAELAKLNMTEDQYRELVAKAEAPFHSFNGEIFIPARNFGAFLAHIAHVAPKNVCKINYQQVRTAVHVKRPGFTTGKTAPDGNFSRFVKLEESNQRSWQSNPFIANFDAVGTLEVDESMLKTDALRDMISWGSKHVGLGAARSQDFGRFSIARFDEVE